MKQLKAGMRTCYIVRCRLRPIKRREQTARDAEFLIREMVPAGDAPGIEGVE